MARQYLIAKDAAQVEELFEGYIEAPAEEVHSKIADPAALYTHVLSLIASGFTGTRHELTIFMNRFFYVHEHRQGRLMQRAVDSALKFLVDEEMVLEIGEHLGATEFGSLVSRLYIESPECSPDRYHAQGKNGLCRYRTPPAHLQHARYATPLCSEYGPAAVGPYDR